MMAYLETYLLLQLVYQASSATNEVLNKRTNVDGGFWYQGELEGHKINLMNSTKETKSDIKYIDSIHSEGLHDRFDPHIVVPNGHKIDEDNPLEENFSLGPLQTQKVDGGERVQKNFWDTFYSHMKVPKGNKIDLSDSVEEPTFMIYEDSSDRKSPKMKTTIITNEINLHETTKESLPSTKTKERITLHEEGKDLLLRKRSNPNMKKPEQHRIHLEKEPRSTSTTNRQRKNVRGNEEIFDSSDEWVFPDLSMSFSMSYPLAKSSESLYSDGFIELSKEEIRDPPSISPTLEDQTDQIFFGSPQIPIGGEDMDTPIPEVSILDPSDTAKIDDVSNHLVSTTNHVPETAKLSKANEIGEITEQAPIIASINMPETKNVGTEKDESEDFPAAPESSSSLAARIHQDKSSSSSSLESNIGAMQSQSDISENQKDPILQSNQNLKDETHFPTLEPSGKSNILTDMVPTLSNVLSNFTEESYNESSQIGNSHICKDIIAADATTVTVRFKYNAQTIEDDKSFVPILEEVISDAVASQILECPNIYNRKLNASTRNLQRSRIIGVVPNPADVVLPGGKKMFLIHFHKN